MYGAFVIFALVTLTQLTGSICYEFSITRDLNNVGELDANSRIHVEITKNDTSVTVKFKIPKTVPYAETCVFFSNDIKNILQVILNEKVVGKFYSIPYKVQKEMTGENTKKNGNEDFIEISGNFPVNWLPENSNKISAAVRTNDGKYYNYYKMQNFKISLPDMMVLEEYRNFTFS